MNDSSTIASMRVLATFTWVPLTALMLFSAACAGPGNEGELSDLEVGADGGLGTFEDGDATEKARLGPTQQAWLTAHNTRRERIHGRAELTYVPLQWSHKLETTAKAYAKTLINKDGCQLKHSYGPAGENLASQQKSGLAPAATTPEQVLVGWFDKETQYPDVGHRWQVAWRSTQHLGCGSASKVYYVGGQRRTCFIQVCHYVRPGNCNLCWTDRKKDRPLMLATNSPCGPWDP